VERRRKSMVRKYFTLVVLCVLALAIGALGQQTGITVQIPGVGGTPWFAGLPGQGIGGFEPLNDLESSGTGNNISGGGPASTPADWQGWSGGNIPISVLTSGPINGARAAVNGMGNAAAVAGAGVVGGPLGALGMLGTLFPRTFWGACFRGDIICGIADPGGLVWQGPTRVGLEPNLLEGELTGGANWGGLGKDHTFDVIDLRTERNIGPITGWQNEETGVARVELANLKLETRGQGLGTEGYNLWERGLPKAIKRVTLNARTTPDAAGNIPRDFWLKQGFTNAPGARPGPSAGIEMFKMINQ
jgi:hypothetical protein